MFADPTNPAAVQSRIVTLLESGDGHCQIWMAVVVDVARGDRKRTAAHRVELGAAEAPDPVAVPHADVVRRGAGIRGREVEVAVTIEISSDDAARAAAGADGAAVECERLSGCGHGAGE